jgi:chemotaxis protein CheZ
VQRKIFRVEQMIASARAPGAAERPASAFQPSRDRRDLPADANVQNLQRELAQLHDMIARHKRELAALIGEGKQRNIARAGDELRAAVDGMDIATQKILRSAEVTDDSAKALAASVKTDFERGLAQDIQDQVVQIYEACNFQDLAGQRISNVIGTLTMIEDQVSAMLGRSDNASGPARTNPSSSGGLLNGPKLDGDSGHANQLDIDRMFA